MNEIYGLFLEKFKLFAAEHPTLGLLGILIGALLVGGVTCFRIKYTLQEKAIALSTQRFQQLMDVLQADNAESVNPLYLELAFQKAFGRKISRDQIVFSLRHRNPTGILFDMWYGRWLVKLNNERTGFVLKRKMFFSLRVRERIVNGTLYLLATPGFMVAFGYSFVNPTIGIIYVAEFTLFFWVLLTSGRTIECARRLLEGHYAHDLRTA